MGGSAGEGMALVRVRVWAVVQALLLLPMLRRLPLLLLLLLLLLPPSLLLPLHPR